MRNSETPAVSAWRETVEKKMRRSVETKIVEKTHGKTVKSKRRRPD